MRETGTGSQAIVGAALLLDEISINHAIELRPVDAEQFASLARPFNNCTREGFVSLIKAINALVPPMNYPDVNGRPNPNNGNPHHKFRVGKENSRVLYLVIHKGYLRGWADKDFDLLAKQLSSMAKAACADESDIEEKGDFTFSYRFWWD